MPGLFPPHTNFIHSCLEEQEGLHDNLPLSSTDVTQPLKPGLSSVLEPISLSLWNELCLLSADVWGQEEPALPTPFLLR